MDSGRCTHTETLALSPKPLPRRLLQCHKLERWLEPSPARISSILKLKVLVKTCRAGKEAAFPIVTGSGETKGSAPRRKLLSRAGLGSAPGFLNIPGNVLSYTAQTRRNLTPTTASATAPLQGISEIDPAPAPATGKGLSPAISHTWRTPKPLNQKAKMNQKGSQSAHKRLPFSFQPRKKTNKNYLFFPLEPTPAPKVPVAWAKMQKERRKPTSYEAH